MCTAYYHARPGTVTSHQLVGSRSWAALGAPAGRARWQLAPRPDAWRDRRPQVSAVPMMR